MATGGTQKTPRVRILTQSSCHPAMTGFDPGGPGKLENTLRKSELVVVLIFLWALRISNFFEITTLS